MGRGMSGGEKWLIGGAIVGLGGLALYYLSAGLGREKNAVFIPDVLEDRIDQVVEALNTEVGKEWVDLGADTLKSILRKVLPKPLVALVDVVHAVEQEASQVRMSARAKRQRASATAVAWGVA